MTAIDALQQVARSASRSDALARWRITTDEAAFWVEYQAPGVFLPEVGTKLHVSASVSSAPEVLLRCLAVLADRGVTFKHVSTLSQLSYLSTGRGGPTQVGKFLTAYPADEVSVLELAAHLHEATVGLTGPRIPHEEPFAAGSLVYSRQGAFSRRWVQLPTGRIAPARRAGDGWEVDERTVRTGAGRVGKDRVIGGKYICTHQVSSSPKGSTHLGFVDNDEGGALVVIKEAYAHTMEDTAGRDARTRLQDEARCLADIGHTGIAPAFLDFWQETASSYLVYVPIAGSPLAALLSDLAGQGLRPPPELVATWTTSLCTAVGTLHAAGYVSCDIKPSNIVMTDDGLRLIDLELAGPPTADPTGGMGTPGYCSPQQADPRRGRSVRDDVYAIGATILSMGTLTDASVLPDLRAVAALEAARNPTSPVYAVAARCLADDDRDRFESVGNITRALARPTAPPHLPTATRSDPLTLAAEIGDRLLQSALGQDAGYVYWRSAHSTSSGQVSRDLYSGSTGPAMFLCALAAATGCDDYLDAAVRCGGWLTETQPVVPRQQPMPGLYFGDCGPALLHLQLHRATGDAVWLQRSQAMSQAVSHLTVRSPDLMTGLAGVGVLHLALWNTVGDGQALSRAADCAAELLNRRAADSPTWRLPNGFDRLSGRTYAGFSHGSAGVGYFLAECALALGNDDLRVACQELADWVIGLARPALPDGSGLCWNAIDGTDTAYGTTWCHGTAGMTRFLLSAHRATHDPAHLDAAKQAGRMTTGAGPWTGTSQCHGLAGSIESLVDLAQETSDTTHLSTAEYLAETLNAYRTPHGWPSDERTTDCPDLMVGEAGVGAALLRLASPASHHLVSTTAFQRPP